MGAASFLTVIGLAKETTEGTPVAATSFLPVTSVTPTETPNYADDTAWRGSMVDVYDTIKGSLHSELDIEGPVFADSIGFLLASLLPDVATTGTTPGPYTHTMAAKNGAGNGQPKTLTVTDFNGVTTRQYPGCKVSDLTLNFTPDGLITYKAKMVGRASSTGSAMTPSFTPVRAQAGWAASFKVGATARVATDFMLSGSVDIKRSAVTPVNGVTGNASPSSIWAGTLGVTAKMSLFYDTDQDVLAVLNGTQQALEWSWIDPGGVNTLTLHATKGQFTAAPVDRGSDYVKVSVDARALANTTDVGASSGYSPIKATLINSIASGTYQ